MHLVRQGSLRECRLRLLDEGVKQHHHSVFHGEQNPRRSKLAEQMEAEPDV
jgi:hypothetical protein